MCLAGDLPAGQHPRCGTSPPGPTPHSIDRVLPHAPWAVPDRNLPGEDGRRSLGALLRNTREQCTDLSLPVPPVSPQRADRGQFAGLRPPCDGLGVDTEHRGDLRGCQQWLGLWCTCGHVRGLSSWTSVAILRCCTAWCSMGSESGMSKFGPTGTILPSPPVTRRPPGAKFLYRNAQFLRRSLSLTVMALRTAPGGARGAQLALSAGGDTRRKPSLSYRDIPERLEHGGRITTSSLLSVTGRYGTHPALLACCGSRPL